MCCHSGASLCLPPKDMKLNRNEFPTFFPSVNLVFREVNLENLEAHRFFAASTVRVVVVVV